MFKMPIKTDARLKLLEMVGIEKYEETYKIIFPDFLFPGEDEKESADTDQPPSSHQ